MPLEEFADAGLVVKVFSALLDDIVLLASDNASVPESEEWVVYRAAELEALRQLDAEGLRQIHRFKRLLGGAIETVTAKEN